MIRNPFNPSAVITNPGDFYGRTYELAQIQRTFEKSSNLVEGIVGVGKSSLSYQAILRMEGFQTDLRSKSLRLTCHRDLTNLDQIAGVLIRQLVDVDEEAKNVAFKFPVIPQFSFGRETSTIVRNYVAGHHLEIFRKLLAAEYIKGFVPDNHLLIIWIDEADKIPRLVTQFVRFVLNQAQIDGVTNVRFLVSGVQPFFAKMQEEDSGMIRFFPRVIRLRTLSFEETEALLQDNFSKFVFEVENSGARINIHPSVISRTVELSNGNPSIAQLLGYKIVDAEMQENDGIIDDRDLLTALRSICHEDRDVIYSDHLSFIFDNELDRKFALLFQEMVRSIPGRTTRARARTIIGDESVKEFIDSNLIYEDSGEIFFVDELFRVRIILDRVETFLAEEEFRKQLLRLKSSNFDERLDDDENVSIEDTDLIEDTDEETGHSNIW